MANEYVQWLDVTADNVTGYAYDNVSAEECSQWTYGNAPNLTNISSGITGIPASNQQGDARDSAPLCGAFWTDTNSSSNPTAVVEWNVGQNNIAQILTFDGNQANTGERFCLNQNPVENTTGTVNYFFNNTDANGVHICQGVNTDCNQFTFENNNPCGTNRLFLDSNQSGLLSFPASTGDQVCFAYWQGDPSDPSTPPTHVGNVSSLGQGITGGEFTWNGSQSTLEQRYTTCQSEPGPTPPGPSPSPPIPLAPTESWWRRYWWVILIAAILIILIIWWIAAASKK